MTGIVDHNGKPFRPSPMSLITRETLDILERMMTANLQAEQDLNLALNLARLRRSCGIDEGSIGATITIRRPARYIPKERP